MLKYRKAYFYTKSKVINHHLYSNNISEIYALIPNIIKKAEEDWEWLKIEEVPSAKGGKMNTELKNAVLATDLKAQYDACAKRLLGQKIILAHILIRVVDEFKGMDAETV